MIVPFFSVGQQGKSYSVTAQRHLNLYGEITDDPDKYPTVFYGTPGTTLRKSFGDTPVRGWIAIGSLYYLVHRGTFWEVNNAGTSTSRGTIDTTSGYVNMAYDGTRILMATGTSLYRYTPGTTTFVKVSDGDAPQAAKTVTWLAGNFIVDQGSGDAFQTSLDSIAWDPLDFATAESNPDGLVRVFTDNGELLLAGENTWEFWGISGGQDFGFSAITGTTGEVGLAARWSLCKFNQGIAFLGKPRQGQVQVFYEKGYRFTPISSQEIDYLINSYASVADATSYSYMLGGHPMLQINFPSAGKSWLFDASTKLWSPLEYGLNGGRHRGELQLDFINKTIISDYSNGNIYNLDSTVYTDNGTAIASEIVSRHIFSGDKRVRIDQLFVDMQVGTGTATGQGVNPQVMLQMSKNNGATWGSELWVKLGKVGEYLQRVVWRRLGVGRDFLFKLRITDPVKRVFIFGDIGRD